MPLSSRLPLHRPLQLSTSPVAAASHCTLSRWFGYEAGNLLPVPFNYDLFAFGRQPVQYMAQVARQVGCCNALH
jgi:hypothetical protein